MYFRALSTILISLNDAIWLATSQIIFLLILKAAVAQNARTDWSCAVSEQLSFKSRAAETGNVENHKLMTY